MSIAVDWFEIPVKDEARATAFYEAVLGTQMQTMSDGTTEMFALSVTTVRPGASLPRTPVRWREGYWCI